MKQRSKNEFFKQNKSYLRDIHNRMQHSRDLVSEYIKDKDVIDWGAGPGHRAKVLEAWGAASIRCWDPNAWCKAIFNGIYTSNQLTWIDNPYDLTCDILYVADLHTIAGDKPFEWWESVLATITCKYIIVTWHTSANDPDRLDRFLTCAPYWMFFSTQGHNTTVDGYELYTSSDKTKILHYQVDKYDPYPDNPESELIPFEDVHVMVLEML